MFEVGLDENLKGIIPRIMTDLFSRIAAESEHFEIEVKASYIEIYNEQLTDLLSKNCVANDRVLRDFYRDQRGSVVGRENTSRQCRRFRSQISQDEEVGNSPVS